MPTPLERSSFPHTSLSCRARRYGVAVLLVGLGAAAGVATAADSGDASGLEARYRSERAACDSEPTADARANCLREAAAARAAAQQGQLEEPQEDYRRNALARCEALPPADRDLCHRRTLGQGETTGSVSSGGILREYREIILPPTPQLEQPAGAASNPAEQEGK